VPSTAVKDATVAWRTAKRAVAGQPTGMRRAARTSRDLRALRRRAPVVVDPDDQIAARRLRRAGYLLPTVHYPEDLIDYLRRGLALTEDPATSVAMGGRLAESVRYAVDPLGHLPRMRELLTPGLADLVRAWHGTEFRITSIRLWRIAHLSPEEQAFHHYGNLWHQDAHPVDVMKMFVQVSDCADTNGSGSPALRLLSRRHTRIALSSGYIGQQQILPWARHFIEKRAVRFDGPPGSVAFLDSVRCLHRAGNPPVGSTRGMIQFMFLPSERPPVNDDYFAEIPPDPAVYEGAIA
jgi:hypothetical protein